MPKSIDFDINKFLDSLTIAERVLLHKFLLLLPVMVLFECIHTLLNFLGGIHEKVN